MGPGRLHTFYKKNNKPKKLSAENSNPAFSSSHLLYGQIRPKFCFICGCLHPPSVAAQPGAVSDQQIPTLPPHSQSTNSKNSGSHLHKSCSFLPALLPRAALQHTQKSKMFLFSSSSFYCSQTAKIHNFHTQDVPSDLPSFSRRHSAALWDTNWRWDCTFCWNQRMASSFPILCLAPMLPVLRFLSAMLKPGLPSTCRTKPTALLHPAAFCFPNLSSFPGGKPGVSSSVMPCCHFCVIPAAAVRATGFASGEAL